MYYLIGRDLDGDGEYEFIRDLEHMILTEDPDRAMQLTERDLDSIDMAYLAEAGFYALEADRFQVSLLEQLLFHPVVRGFRPLVPPPPRRPRAHRAPHVVRCQMPRIAEHIARVVRFRHVRPPDRQRNANR